MNNKPNAVTNPGAATNPDAATSTGQLLRDLDRMVADLANVMEDRTQAGNDPPQGLPAQAPSARAPSAQAPSAQPPSARPDAIDRMLDAPPRAVGVDEPLADRPEIRRFRDELRSGQLQLETVGAFVRTIVSVVGLLARGGR